MRQERTLRPIDLARMAGISATQVRTYEQVGFLPTAERSPAGYRRYTADHAQALRVARCLIAGYGWQPARQVMRAVHAGDHAAALAVVDARHAHLNRQRDQLDQTQLALENMELSPSAGQSPSGHRRRPLSIGAAAQAVGVRVSALRHWEKQQLVHPAREPATRNRYYDHQQLQRLHVIALLRKAGYRAGRIRAVLDDLTTGQPEQLRQAVRQRHRTLNNASQRALRASATLHAYLHRGGGPTEARPEARR